ncbi:CO dehydrogenase nickel-insertion accessory protein CooC1 [Pedobacter sp. CG_S7]
MLVVAVNKISDIGNVNPNIMERINKNNVIAEVIALQKALTKADLKVKELNEMIAMAEQQIKINKIKKYPGSLPS